MTSFTIDYAWAAIEGSHRAAAEPTENNPHTMWKVHLTDRPASMSLFLAVGDRLRRMSSAWSSYPPRDRVSLIVTSARHAQRPA